MNHTLSFAHTPDALQLLAAPEQFQGFLAPALAPAALAASSPASAIILAVGGVFAILLAAYVAFKRGLGSTSYNSYKLRNLSPEKITGHRPTFTEEEMVKSAELLADSIAERATEMNRAISEDRSEVRIEMCAIGYRKCANDVITLTHLVNEELKGAGFARRWRLVRIRKQAVDALSKVRENLPEDALKSARREMQ